jgi:tRNA(Ile)-lysidine synthase
VQELDELSSAVQPVPAGAWAVGVSGGADSVALLSLLRQRADLSLRVVHLDHQTRQGQSALDAKFVEELSRRWNLPCDIAKLDEILPSVSSPPKNRSARFRAARLALFRRVVDSHGLFGVILAHHAEDQAETILLRLLRGSGFSGLRGMSRRSVVGGLTILRPLLGARRAQLREHLQSLGQTWREDESNQSLAYARNRVRHALESRPVLVSSLIELGESCTLLGRWANDQATPPPEMPVKTLQDLPTILARPLARKWLISQGASAGELSPAVLDRLILMARDRASPRRQDFPGPVSIVRHRGILKDASEPH